MRHGRHGIRFETKMLEIVRKHLWSEEKRKVLYRAIGLKPGSLVVEVGCGTGAFGRVLARNLDSAKGGRLVGVDRNNELLQTARGVSRLEGFSKVMSFKCADVLAGIPLPDNFADIVICQSFLWLHNDDNRLKAVEEMARVCRPGGVVAAVEGAVDTNVTYAGEDPRFNELVRKSSMAEIEGYRKMYGYDRNTGYKLPYFFKSAGLRRIKVKGFAHVELQGDDSVPFEYKKEMLRYFELRPARRLLAEVESCKTQEERMAVVEEREPIMVAGGMTYDEIIELNKLWKSRAERILGNARAFHEDVTLSAGTGFLSTGIKPSPVHGVEGK